MAPPIPPRPPIGLVPISAIEKETGLTKEVIRKWESRYGFPLPARDDNGNRLYPAEQIDRLRLIRHLIGTGYRPGKIVRLSFTELDTLVRQLSSPADPPTSTYTRQILEALTAHDLPRLRDLFKQQWARDGLASFIGVTLAQLTTTIGEAWLRGEIRLFEEHLYTEVVLDVLHEAIRTVTGSAQTPRLLLATPSGEIHTLGLMMAEAIAAMERAHCIRLGAQIPVPELIAAATACQADIVALSFSVACPARDVAQTLTVLREQLPPEIELWAGGHGTSGLRPLSGICCLNDLAGIGPALHHWRQAHPGRG